METKELKIQVPEGYEIDKENSTFEYIKFKSIKKDITYEKISKELLFNKPSFYISDRGEVRKSILRQQAIDKNNATNEEQLERILALNELFNIAVHLSCLIPMRILLKVIKNIEYSLLLLENREEKNSIQVYLCTFHRGSLYEDRNET